MDTATATSANRARHAGLHDDLKGASEALSAAIPAAIQHGWSATAIQAATGLIATEVRDRLDRLRP